MDDLICRDDVYDVLKKVSIHEMPIYVFDKLWNGIRDLSSIEPEEQMAKVKNRFSAEPYQYGNRSAEERKDNQMTTLDNVIDAMERCSIPHYFNCKGCPYEDDDAEVGCRSNERDADVLHFLKELRYILDNLVWVEPEEKGHWEIRSLMPDGGNE